jgi:hypothetical protein
MATPQQSDVKSHLQQGLQQAKADYEATKTGFEFAICHLRDLGPEHPDGKAWLHKAIVAHNLALAKYKSALEIFNGFVASGKLP